MGRQSIFHRYPSNIKYIVRGFRQSIECGVNPGACYVPASRAHSLFTMFYDILPPMDDKGHPLPSIPTLPSIYSYPTWPSSLKLPPTVSQLLNPRPPENLHPCHFQTSHLLQPLHRLPLNPLALELFQP